MSTDTTLYPTSMNTVDSRCNHCWQPGPSALCRDPLGDEPSLTRLCSPCDRTLRAGRPVELTDEQLAEMWEWLAHQHINHKAGEATGVTDEHIDRALAAHTPAWMPPQAGWERFGALCDDLSTWHKAEAGDVDYASLEPEWRDAAAYAIHCRGLVDDAVAKLAGRRTR